MASTTAPRAVHRPDLRLPSQPRRRRASRQRPCTNGAATNPATSRQARHDPDHELLSVNVRLAKHRQALLDANRIERKAFREHARVENAAAAYARELAALLDERGFTQDLLLSEAPTGGEAVLVVQLSDLHFNERVELPSNRYDFTVAAARLAKLAGRIKQLGRSYGATKVVIASLGDFLNSDRRLDELLSNATNRSKATLLAVDILRAFLLDLRSEFELEVYGITGNESRVKPELGWSDELATDSYDLMIYAILRRGFEVVDGIAFCGFQANELLFEVMGRTFLCLHGHQVGANVQKSVQEITGKVRRPWHHGGLHAVRPPARHSDRRLPRPQRLAGGQQRLLRSRLELLQQGRPERPHRDRHGPGRHEGRPAGHHRH
jgi:predicted phosphodiesterase